MKKRLNILLLSLLFLVAGTFSVSAQIVDAEGQYVDTVFHDNVDRTAEDFVQVSLLISQPSSARVYSLFGHAALRLQCPIFNLDYVFSYISIHREASLFDYMVIKPTMGLISVPTKQYIEDEFRGVREYNMFLPPKVETELWRILDENVAEGYNTPFNWITGNCTQKLHQYLHQAMITYYPKDSISIQWLFEQQYTIRELMNHYSAKAPWHRMLMNSVGYSYVDCVGISNAKKILFPEQLLVLLHHTTLCGKPILSNEAKVHTRSEVMTAPLVTPISIAIMLLLLALLSLCTIFYRKSSCIINVGKGTDYVILGLQTIAGAFLMLMMWVAYLPFPQTDWNWLLIPFNILPAICWKWRKYWALPYAMVLAVWCLLMVFVPHMLVDTTHIILALAFAIVLLKQSNVLQRLINKSVAQDTIKLSNRSLTKK